MPTSAEWIIVATAAGGCLASDSDTPPLHLWRLTDPSPIISLPPQTGALKQLNFREEHEAFEEQAAKLVQLCWGAYQAPEGANATGAPVDNAMPDVAHGRGVSWRAAVRGGGALGG